MNIPRAITADFISHISPGKVVVLYGPRRVGKTTFLQEIAAKTPYKTLFLNGESSTTQADFKENNATVLQHAIGGYELVLIDEAQNIPFIGSRLKFIVDTFPQIRLIASGSSSFDLATQLGEPLTGRKITYTLFPIAQLELKSLYTPVMFAEELPSRLVFGSYPEIFLKKNKQEKELYLRDLVDSYLYKDILELDGIRNARKIKSILALLAFQIGKLVSVNEIAQGVEMSRTTIVRYLDLLEKAFVIRYVGGFSRNLRKEITKNGRYYFFDNGVRNALISNFNDISLRNDIGQLWENFIVMERIKKLAYTQTVRNTYFWRTHDRQEIDWVEEGEGKLWGYEIKWNKDKVRIPSQWKLGYPDASFEVITRHNYTALT